MAQHTMQELKIRQALPLDIKVRMTQQRIREWVSEFGEEGVYVSFSGGKDSTVLLHLVRELYPSVPAVFVDTGLEYPEIREFVKTFENVVWLKPKMNFKQVIQKFGYPFISKEVSNCVYGARKYLTELNKRMTIATYRQTDKIHYACYMADIIGMDRRQNKANPLYLELKMGNIPNYRLQRLRGELKNKDGGKSQFNQEKYAFFLEAPFEISDRCCNVMKKNPAHAYERETNRKPFLATMAEESTLRMQKWLHEGCNAFDGKNPHSKPMSFWTEQDVLRYIKVNNIKIASVYGDVVTDDGEELEGQMDIADYGLAEDVRSLKTTGCKRTGCMFCGYGCHLEKSPNRFERMKETHPKQYEYIMKPVEKGGLGYKEIIDWINEHGNMNIKY